MSPKLRVLRVNRPEVAPLTEGVDFTVKTQYGDVKLRGFCGRCRKTGEFEIPFKVRFCRGERCAMSPLLERNAAGSARLTRSAQRHEGTEVD